MDVTEVPFLKLLGIAHCDPADKALLMLPEAECYANHVNTVHASAQFAVGEAASGECLLQRFRHLLATHAFVAVVRRAEVKFKQPARGAIKASACITDAVAGQTVASIEKKGWALLAVHVDVTDSNGKITMTANYEWFIKAVETRPA